MKNVLSATGKYQGQQKNGTDRFLGIPYAQKPVGKLRFKAPKKITEEINAPFLAMNYPANPLQKGKIETSEDCLYLNIWRPAKFNDQTPVLVWIYGGSFETGGIGKKGSGVGLTYDGVQLAKDTGCIIVTVNYRLNVFGFLDLSSFSSKFESNIGVKDVICALEWIQENIDEFGGNPQNVTLFGQSAGAMLIASLNKVPTATSLYHKMIIASACIESLYTKQEAQELASYYLKLLGVAEENSEDLFSFSSEKLLSVTKELEQHVREKMLGITTFCPVVDGSFLTEKVYQGEFVENKPMIIGSTNQEASLFVRFSKGIEHETGQRFFPYFTPAIRQDIISNYKNFPSYRKTSQLLTDIMYTVPKYWLADQYAKQNDVYVYRFDFSAGLFTFLQLGACHIIDVPIQFGMATYLYFPHIFTAKRIGKKIRETMGQFVKTGKPNNEHIIWPKYDTTQSNVLLIDREAQVVNDPDKQIRAIYTKYDRFYHR